MPIHTVLGPIEASELGRTSIHEHLLSDLSLWAKTPTEPLPDDPVIGPELAGYLRWNALSLPENLVLDDPALAADELAHVAAAGGSAVVELTLEGMGRRLEELPEISRRSGVHIVVGSGFYVEDTMPDRVRDADVDALTEIIVDQLREGLGPGGIRPALIGEVGTSWPITAAERRSLRASARAGVETGATVYTHQSFRGRGGVDVLEVLREEGMPVERIVIGHLDELWDKGYHREIAQAGAILAYDTFGTDAYYGSPALRSPSDAERLDMVEWLLSEGYAEQLVIGGDLWMKSHLHRNGGHGYDHLFRRIAPAIAALGGESVAEQVMVTTPRRLLDRP